MFEVLAVGLEVVHVHLVGSDALHFLADFLAGQLGHELELAVFFTYSFDFHVGFLAKLVRWMRALACTRVSKRTQEGWYRGDTCLRVR